MNLQAAAPLIILSLTAALLLAVIAARRSHGLTASVTAFGIATALLSIPYALNARHPAMVALFTFNPASLSFIGLILASALLILGISTEYSQGQTALPREEFPLLLILGTIGACALAASASFITVFLGLETMTLAMIGMIAYPHFRPQAEEAGLKYLILSGMSSGFVLFGIALIELSCGSLNFVQALAWNAPDAPSHAMILAGLSMLGIGAGFKLSVVPFHVWVPDIYGGAPAPSGAYVAVIAKIAVLAVLIRVLAMPGAALMPGMVHAISLIAIASMLIGNLLALLQDNIKRILGYSSIAHLGYLLVAMLSAGAIGQIAETFYITTYAISMTAAFGVIAAMSNAEAPCDIDKLDDFRSMFWTRPGLAATMTLALLSLAGMPPAIGFIAKMYIMAAGVHAELWSLTAVIIVSSVIGLFYYLNIILTMAARPSASRPPVSQHISLTSRLAMAAIGLPMLAFGIAPQPLIALLKLMFG